MEEKQNRVVCLEVGRRSKACFEGTIWMGYSGKQVNGKKKKENSLGSKNVKSSILDLSISERITTSILHVPGGFFFRTE